MGAHKPRSGSLAFYPRVRAKKQLAAFSTYPDFSQKTAVKPITFYGYKAGMVHVFGKNAHEKSISYGQEVMIPATVIECPPLKVIGVRAYSHTTAGSKVLGETTIDKIDKNLRKKLKTFKKRGKKKINSKEGKNHTTLEDLEKLKDQIEKIVFIVEAQPSLTGIGKKKADIAQVHISGNVEAQLSFAKEKFGKEIRVSEVFAPAEFVDVKAVDKGKGFVGVVKRAHVKIHRPKAKKHRYVGSIGPWHPAGVMWTVPRAGQLGYQTRTEYNKRILQIDDKIDALNPAGGFSNYGKVAGDFVLLAGSVPGPAKRIVSLRPAIRVHNENLSKFTDIKFVAKVSGAGK